MEGLNHLTERLCQKAQVPSTDIYLMTVVGNTVMLHTLLGVSALSIANAPFVPVFSEQLELEAKELGIDINPLGEVVLLPSVSGYVGADIIADMLVCGLESQRDSASSSMWALMARLYWGQRAVSSLLAAAGPAFEGANLSCGWRESPGHIRLPVCERPQGI